MRSLEIENPRKLPRARALIVLEAEFDNDT